MILTFIDFLVHMENYKDFTFTLFFPPKADETFIEFLPICLLGCGVCDSSKKYLEMSS